MAASGSGGEPEERRPWTAASTWAPAGGAAVEGVVSFETSDYDAEAAPSAIVLDRPPSDGGGDPLPCEVTVNFRGKYEIHRVYVRSTARIYEIYYSTHPKDTTKDYLCTVRCGLVAKEPMAASEENMAQWGSNAAASEKHENETKSVTSSSDEDSWVEVKIPESPLESNNVSYSLERNVTGICQRNTMAHYEATAEITDASPCVSLTVRLLSLQSKESVHIEEIYILADPIDSTDDDSVAAPGNMGGSSLLAMLVPGLMQMSKSRNWKVDDKYFSDGLRTQLPEGCTMKESIPCKQIVQEAGPCSTNDSKFRSAGIESRPQPIVGGTVSNENGNQDEFPSKDPMSLPLPVQRTGNTQVPVEKFQRVSNTDQPANSLMNENSSHNRIERMLDSLLSKVEKMEIYCSRFEDNLMRPLGSIDARLQRLEQQFDSLFVEIQFLRGSSARTSVPDGMSDTTNSHDKTPNDGNSSTPACITSRQPGLVVRAPEFSLDDSCGYDVADANPVTLCGSNMVPRFLVKAPDFICDPESTCEKLHDGPVSPVDFDIPSEKERKTSPGLAIKVPEFPNDEVDEDNEAEGGDHDNGHAKPVDTLSKDIIDSSKSKTPVSIDGALASALDAFLASAKGMPPSKSVNCTASNSSAGNTDDSTIFSYSPKQVDNGSASQYDGKYGNANKVDTSISYQEADETPHASLSNVDLVGKVQVNEQNVGLNADKMAFVASTEPSDVPSWPQTGTVFDGTQVNGQHADLNSCTMPFVTSTEPLGAPSLPPTVLESVDDGARVKEKPPVVLESVGDTAQANENRHASSLAEFLAARNGASKVCHSKDGAGLLSFERSADAGKNLKGGNSKSTQKNTTDQLLLLKKAFDIDKHDSKCFDNISTDTTFEALKYAAPANVDDEHSTNAMATSPDEGGDLDSTANSITISDETDSLFFKLHENKKGWIENMCFDSSLHDSFTKPKMDHSWPEFSSMEPSGGAPAKEASNPGNTTTGNSAEDLFTGIGVSSTVTSLSGLGLRKVDDIVSLSFVTKRTSESSPSLEVLLAESSDSEAQISDLEDTDNDACFGSAQLFSTFSSSDDDASASSEPLADLVGLPIPPDAFGFATNDPLIDVIDLTDPSGTYTPAACEPLADVVDLPNPSGTCMSSANKPLVSIYDLPKPSEAFAGGSSGEHPDSLI